MLHQIISYFNYSKFFARFYSSFYDIFSKDKSVLKSEKRKAYIFLICLALVSFLFAGKTIFYEKAPITNIEVNLVSKLRGIDHFVIASDLWIEKNANLLIGYIDDHLSGKREITKEVELEMVNGMKDISYLNRCDFYNLGLGLKENGKTLEEIIEKIFSQECLEAEIYQNMHIIKNGTDRDEIIEKLRKRAKGIQSQIVNGIRNS